MPAAESSPFVSLAQLVRGAGLAAAPVAAAPVEAAPLEAAPAPIPELAELARDVRVFRARLADAFEAAGDALLRDFAYALLGRELVLAAADIAAIAARVLADHPDAQPLRLRVAPSDAAGLAACDDLPPRVPDPELAPGDAILEFAGGPVDARLGVRLAALLEDAR